MSNPIKLGLVGIGRAGWGMHTNEIAGKEDKYQYVAACDLIPERVEMMVEKYGCKGYDNIDALIADPDVEIVAIATRSCDHFEHAAKALKAGKDVLIEKPIGLTLKQAEDLFAMANKPGTPKLYVRHNRRFESVFNEVLNTVNSGVLGNVYEINISQGSFQHRNDWQTISEFGGGQLLNWGPHIIDHSLRLLGSPIKNITGELKQVTAGGDCEDHVIIHFESEGGRTVNMCISGGMALKSCRTFEVFGDRGSMLCGYTGNEYDIKLRYINPEQKLDPVVSDPGTPGASFGASGTFAAAVELDWIEKEYKAPDQDLTVIWDYMYDSYRSGAEYPIKDSEALEVMYAVEQIRKGTKFDFHK
ncbi:MAG: Gfo/Idh/MocA family oxidoreductase [Clostridia bacterium]|nr:Gfo/Idh/MocA family oxidoreductase [Clostridia bacterium]